VYAAPKFEVLPCTKEDKTLRNVRIRITLDPAFVAQVIYNRIVFDGWDPAEIVGSFGTESVVQVVAFAVEHANRLDAAKGTVL
jgi:hypothetical protein